MVKSVIVHINNITQTENHQSACELFRSYSYDPNQKRSSTGFKSVDTALFILSLKITIKKNPRSTKLHIATIFNRFMTGGNKRVYILKQTCT